MRLSCIEGGSGNRLLLLLHGLGGNVGVWDPMLPLIHAEWKGRWIAPDLRGHGMTGAGDDGEYGLAAHVADVATLLEGEPDVVVLGHSMGGAIAIALAAERRPDVRVAAFGVKNAWPEAMLERFGALAQAPARYFATSFEAAERAVLTAGVKGLFAADSRLGSRGIALHDAGWRLALDNRAFAIAGIEVAEEARQMADRLLLLRGSEDTIATYEETCGFDLLITDLVGLGHNPHVEAPAALWAAAKAFLQY